MVQWAELDVTLCDIPEAVRIIRGGCGLVCNNLVGVALNDVVDDVICTWLVHVPLLWSAWSSIYQLQNVHVPLRCL